MITRLLQRLSVLIFVLLMGAGGYAQGDLMILPKRLVFDGSQRSQEISLANTGTDTATYAISIVNYRMTETGSFEEITEPDQGQRFAENFLRFYPRRVTLGPREAQAVRVQVTRTGNMEPGEYRSHIYFRAVEKQTALGAEEAVEDQENISIDIRAVFGVSIPTIIRNGQSTTDIELSELILDTERENPVLSIAIKRSGNMSVYGEMLVSHIAPNGKETEVGKVRGISVYTPNELRIFAMELQDQEVDLTQGSLLVTYEDKATDISVTEKLTLGNKDRLFLDE